MDLRAELNSQGTIAELAGIRNNANKHFDKYRQKLDKLMLPKLYVILIII
jgi:hypothetical protein